MLWILQNRELEEVKRLKESLLKKDMKVATLSIDLLSGLEKIEYAKDYGYPNDIFDVYDTEEVIFYGSIQACRYLYKNSKWQIWTPETKFDWSHYSQFFDGLLNRKYVMMPFHYIPYFFSQCPQGYFVKPDNGYKPFTGTKFSGTDFKKELKILEDLENISSDEMCVVAERKILKEEYRCLVADGEVVTGSQYLPEEVPAPKEILDYAQDQVIYADKRGYEPPKMWTIDIAIHNNSPYVLEVNSFSSAGLYDMDYDKVIEVVNEQARQQIAGNF